MNISVKAAPIMVMAQSPRVLRSLFSPNLASASTWTFSSITGCSGIVTNVSRLIPMMAPSTSTRIR